MPSRSFTRKQLRVTFELSNNANFEGTNSNTLVLEGLRIIANLKSAGAPIAPSAQVQVFGMKQSDMNALTMLAWKPLGLQRNTLRIESNTGDGWSLIFSGQIIEAGPDYTAMPDVALRVQALSLYFETIKPANPSSYTGTTKVADIVADLAKQMGKTFENNGVTGVLENPYLPNTLGDQLKSVCEQAGVDLYIDADTIAITPRATPRSGPDVFISPATGLQGTPTIDKVGIEFITLFDPALKFGGSVNVQVGNTCPKANGRWYVYALDHLLESEKPGGAWFSNVSCSEFGRLVVPNG